MSADVRPGLTATIVKTSKADFGQAGRIGQALFQPFVEHGLGHRVIGGGGHELQLDGLLAFGSTPRFADHLEQVGGFLPFQERSGQCAIDLGRRLRGQELFVKRLRLFNLTRLTVAIGQKVLERNVLRIATRGRFQPGSDFLFTIQRLQYLGQQLVGFDQRRLALDVALDQGQGLIPFVQLEQGLGQGQRNRGIILIVYQAAFECLDRQIVPTWRR